MSQDLIFHMEIMNNKQRSVFVTIVGIPNVGKSSILNRILGHKIAIVSSKPQTTRTRITGILTDGDDQLVFIDTPGLLKPRNELGEYMVKAINEDLTQACPLVTPETLLVWGADDEDTPLTDGQLMERLMPDAALVAIPDAGHFCFLDQPAAFAAILTSFLPVGGVA